MLQDLDLLDSGLAYGSRLAEVVGSLEQLARLRLGFWASAQGLPALTTQQSLARVDRHLPAHMFGLEAQPEA